MRITNEYISLEGFVVADDISSAASNFRTGIDLFDTYEDARQSYQYQESVPAKIYKIESQVKEY